MNQTIQQDAASSVVRTERVLAATGAAVFEAFERPEFLARWWGPKGFTSTFSLFEFRPGGRWVFTMHGSNGVSYPNECVFAEIQPGSRIVIDHVVNPRYRLTVTFEASGANTRLDWSQEFESPEAARKMRPLCGPANEEVLDRLQALLDCQEE